MTRAVPSRRRAALLSAPLVVLMLAACQLELRDQETLPDPVADSMRVVSLSPSLTEIVFAVGGGEHLVGATRYCDYPPEARSVPRVGGLVDPNFEAIVGLRPDVVLVQDDVSFDQTARQFREFGIEPIAVSNQSVPDILDAIQRIGECCGSVETAATLRRDLEARIEAVRARTAGLPRPSVLIAVGGHTGQRDFEEVFVASAGTFLDGVIELAGGHNACCEQGGPFPRLSREGLLYLDPDVVIDLVPDLEELGWSAEVLRNDWLEVFSRRSGTPPRVQVFGDDYVVTPGPRVVDLLEQVAALLHPSLANRHD